MHCSVLKEYGDNVLRGQSAEIRCYACAMPCPVLRQGRVLLPGGQSMLKNKKVALAIGLRVRYAPPSTNTAYEGIGLHMRYAVPILT